MRSLKRGKSTSAAEVLNISPNGFWLLSSGTEYFLPFKKFPWFKNASVEEIFEVTSPHPGHLHWASLDVDLEEESLNNLEQYPLVAKHSGDKSGRKKVKRA